MATNTLTSPTATAANPLGNYLKDRRAKLDPAEFGFASSLAVDGQPGLGMIIYTSATTEDAERVPALVARRELSAS